MADPHKTPVANNAGRFMRNSPYTMALGGLAVVGSIGMWYFYNRRKIDQDRAADVERIKRA